VFSYQSCDELLVIMEACSAVLWDTFYDPAWAHLLQRDSCEDSLRGGCNAVDNERMSWTADLITAIDHCHKMRVIHRDVNPWNVFICEATSTQTGAMLQAGKSRILRGQCTAKLGDFGLAAQMAMNVEILVGLESEGCAALDDSALTSLYSAPELGKEYSFPADIYSLGMSIFALWATAECKTEDLLIDVIETRKQSQDSTCANSILYLERVSRSLHDVLLSMLHHAPDERPKAEKISATLCASMVGCETVAVQCSMVECETVAVQCSMVGCECNLLTPGSSHANDDLSKEKVYLKQHAALSANPATASQPKHQGSWHQRCLQRCLQCIKISRHSEVAVAPES